MVFRGESGRLGAGQVWAVHLRSSREGSGDRPAGQGGGSTGLRLLDRSLRAVGHEARHVGEGIAIAPPRLLLEGEGTSEIMASPLTSPLVDTRGLLDLAQWSV